jgi:hypothetical protein
MPADHPAGPQSSKMGSMGKTAMKTLKLSVEETWNLTMDWNGYDDCPASPLSLARPVYRPARG